MAASTNAPRIPLLVLGGFLGAGKTTLLRHLLSQSAAEGGLRWLALVNDFGEVNLDAELIAEQHADTIALTNGCVCCSIGGDLSQALIEVLARRPLPEAIVIEASGVSDPWRVAQIGMAAPELLLDSVTVVVDASTVLRHAHDPMLADTLSRPLAHADLVLLNKADSVDDATLAQVQAWVDQHAPNVRRLTTVQAQVPLAVLSAAQPTGDTAQATASASRDAAECSHDEPHGHDHGQHDAHHHAHDQEFSTWSARPTQHFDEAALSKAVQALPPQVLRVKGVLRTERGWRQLQFAGTRVRWQAASATEPIVIAIGVGPDWARELRPLFDDASAPA